ncbi:MAG: MarR family transcriptional regulator [Candidatus Omnitrophica bacterium]|nr:MarR family transcriptional regulator [Candidatus Omnitrophota bacterium]
MKENKPFHYETEIAKTAGALHRELANRLNRMFAGGKLTISHMIVLELLNEKKCSNMSEIAKILDLTMGAVTAIVDKMVEVQLVKRGHSEEDRRIVEVCLTKKGIDTAKKVTKNRLEIIKEVFSVMTKQEKQQYLKLLNKVYNGLRNRKQ